MAQRANISALRRHKLLQTLSLEGDIIPSNPSPTIGGTHDDLKALAFEIKSLTTKGAKAYLVTNFLVD